MHAVVHILIGGLDKGAKGLLQQRCTRTFEQAGEHQVGLNDPALDTDAAIAHRGKVIEIAVTGPRQLQGVLDTLQFFVLRLQLGLLNTEFMHQPQAVRQRFAGGVIKG